MPGFGTAKWIKDVGGEQTHAYLSIWCKSMERVRGALSPEQETNERQMECLSSEGCKSRSKICKTGGDKWRGPYSGYYACVRVTAWWHSTLPALRGKEVASFHRRQNKILSAAHFASRSGCTQTGEGALMVFRPSGPMARVDQG